MTTGTGAAAAAERLLELHVADPPGSWAAAGFTVVDDAVRLGDVTIQLTGASADPTARRGITRWVLSGVEVDGDALDGLPTTVADAPSAAPDHEADAHPNGAIGLDHVVVLTPDLERTLAALDAAGLDLRRIRDTTSNGSPMRQAFFRLGPVILEVVSGDVGSGLPATDAPATWFGLAVDVDDLDTTAALLGDRIGRTKAAVQRGRRIATLRHRALGMSVAVAAMDRRAPDPGDATVTADGTGR